MPKDSAEGCRRTCRRTGAARAEVPKDVPTDAEGQAPRGAEGQAPRVPKVPKDRRRAEVPKDRRRAEDSEGLKGRALRSEGTGAAV